MMPSFYSPTFTTSPTQFNFTSQAPFNFSHCHHPSPKSPKPRSNWFTHIVSSLCLDFFKVQVRSNQDPITSSRLNPAKTLHQSGQSCKQQKQAVTRAEKEPNQRGLISSQDPWSTRPRDHTGTRGGGWVASATIKTTLLEHGGGAPRPPLPPRCPWPLGIAATTTTTTTRGILYGSPFLASFAPNSKTRVEKPYWLKPPVLEMRVK